jgi:hypothetical protein
MDFSFRIRKGLVALGLIICLGFTTACAGVATKPAQATYPTTVNRTIDYGQLARGDSATGQEFGNWVVEASKGLIKDVFVRDDNKLGAVISSEVSPKDVKNLAQSLAQGFRKSFPNKDLSVLIYAPDKKLILTALYDSQSKQIEYKPAS